MDAPCRLGNAKRQLSALASLQPIIRTPMTCLGGALWHETTCQKHYTLDSIQLQWASTALYYSDDLAGHHLGRRGQQLPALLMVCTTVRTGTMGTKAQKAPTTNQELPSVSRLLGAEQRGAPSGVLSLHSAGTTEVRVTSR